MCMVLKREYLYSRSDIFDLSDVWDRYCRTTFNVLLGGQRLLGEESDVDLDDNKELFRHTRILSIAQDIMFDAGILHLNILD